MIAKFISQQDVLNHENRNYNPQQWERDVKRFDDAHFWYLIPKGNGYDYDRIYVEYTTDDGLRLVSPFPNNSLTNGGFYRFDMDKTTKDGKTISDAIELIQNNRMDEMTLLLLELDNSDTCTIQASTFSDGNGNQVLFDTSKAARQEMIKRSREFGIAFTKGL
jgi:hypothetical protein